MKHNRSFLVLALMLAPVLTYSHPDSCHLTDAFLPFTAQDPPIPPMVTFLVPSEIVAGGPAFSLTVNGNNFIPTSIVQWNGTDRTTAYLGPTQLTAMITAADIVLAGTATVTVLNPIPGGGASNPVVFTVSNPLPVVFGMSPASVAAGGSSFSLTVNGANFIASSVVQWNGLGRPTTYVDSSRVTATISAGDIPTAGSQGISVVNPGPGGGTSSVILFAVREPDNPLPRISLISPSIAAARTGWFSLTVNGSGFVKSSVVQWNGNNRNTLFTSATQLTATIYPSDIASAGTALITVFNPTPGGGTSNSQEFTIQPGATPPSATGTASPSPTRAGEAVLLVVKVTPGTNPASTGLNVTADLSSIGGSSTQQLYDDGTHGDATRGDNLFTFRAVISTGTASGKKALPVTVTDAQGRKSTSSIQLAMGPGGMEHH